MADKKGGTKSGAKRPKGGIGRGLKGLIKGHVAPEDAKQAMPSQPRISGPDVPGFKIEIISIGRIDPNPGQPRQHMDEDDESLETLAESIKQHGLINPLTVRPHPQQEGRFMLIAGHRRLSAARRAGLTQIPVIIQETDEVTAYEKALVENIQRENLDPIEEAEAYQFLLETRGYSQDELARRVGRSRAAIANKIRLLKLPQSVRELIIAGELTEGHGRALLMAEDPALMEELAHTAVRRGLSVRELERMASRTKEDAPRKDAPEPPPYIATVQELLRQRLGTKVKLKAKKRGRTSVTIEFFDEEKLQEFLTLLGIEETD